MRFVVYTCEDCREPVTVESDSDGRLPQSAKCPKCGGVAASKGLRGRNASTGEIRSTNAGCGVGQEMQGNADLAANDIDAHYAENGDLVAANRQSYNEALACRGLNNHTDGGFSTNKVHRIRERSRQGNLR